MLSLVKDFENYRVVFYWRDESHRQISPSLPTPVHAKEWYLRYVFSLYEGNERRQRICERRNTSPQQVSVTLATRRNEKFSGRRTTDIPIAVDVDLACNKLKQLMGEGRDL